MKINPENSSDSLHHIGTHGHDHGGSDGHRHSHGGDGRRPGSLPGGHAADEDDHGDHDDHDHGQPGDLLRIGCVAAAIAVGGSGIARGLAPFDLFSLGATLGGGLPIFQHALQALRRRRMTMELSMTVALAAAMAIGELFTSAVIVLFVLIAEVLEGLTVSRGRSAIQDLLVYLPRNTQVKRGEEWVTVSVDTLTVGDVVLVRPGDSIPADGVILSGSSHIDESTITGESVPVEKNVGSAVFAGTTNYDGALELRVEFIGEDTTFGKIVRAVEHADKSRAPIQRIADRLAGWLVYAALIGAVLTFVFTRDIRSTISVIIVAGACGVAAGTPLAILGGIGTAARRGSIIKGGVYLEALAGLKIAVLDKTGTLTLGRPEVTEIWPAEGVSEELLIASASRAEVFSEHPLARAVQKLAATRGLAATAGPHSDGFEYVPGRGVRTREEAGEWLLAGTGAFLVENEVTLSQHPSQQPASEVWVARNGTCLGVLRIADPIRPEAREAIDALRALGVETRILSGDSPAIVKAVGDRLGIHHAEGGLLPSQKLEQIEQLSGSGIVVAMVGDGVNDAPALARATVGIAMGSGTAVAQESADIVLLGNDLMKLPDTVGLARRCRRIILQNFVGTLLVDGVGVVLAATGHLNPLAAAFIHVTSELAFISNSARLLPGLRSGGLQKANPDAAPNSPSDVRAPAR